jgi:hypothetical protein
MELLHNRGVHSFINLGRQAGSMRSGIRILGAERHAMLGLIERRKEFGGV